LEFELFHLVEADLRDRAVVFDIFRQYNPEIVVHLAAKAGVRPSLENPFSYVETNVNGTVHILDASVQFGVKKFIFASSSSVYGLNEKVPFAEEDSILNQASPYGATKAAGEALCRSYSNCYGLPIVALRFFTVFGPRQRPDLAIHKFAKNILNNKLIQLYGDGTTSRDYTYVEDIINGIRAALDYNNAGYELFNLGNDRPTKLIDLVSHIEKALGINAKIEWLPEQIGDVPHTWANIDKSRRLLNYNPQMDIVTGISYFVEWLKNDLIKRGS
jgi:UDP-glucuronate 4-epimerase